MPYTAAQKRANKKYKEKAYEQIAIRVRKGKREEYKRFAESTGESLAGLITRLLDEEMKRRAPDPD